MIIAGTIWFLGRRRWGWGIITIIAEFEEIDAIEAIGFESQCVKYFVSVWSYDMVQQRLVNDRGRTGHSQDNP